VLLTACVCAAVLALGLAAWGLVALMGGSSLDSEWKKLNGTWAFSQQKINGERSHPKESAEMIVTNGRYTVHFGTSGYSGRIKIDPSKSPKEIELVPDDSSMPVGLGVYEIKDDVLIVQSSLDYEVRPKAIDSNEGHWLMLRRRKE
jgi:uncharacterized protein (TIGR03067 family)